MSAPCSPRSLALFLWRAAGAASTATWLWSLGGGAVITALFSALLRLPRPWDLVLAAGVFLLALATILSLFARFRGASSEPGRPQERQPGSGSTTTGPEPRPAEGLEQAPSPSPSPAAPARGSGTDTAGLSALLQKRLDQGVALRKNAPAMVGMVRIDRPTTTAADVDAWIRRTKALLAGTPDLLAEFNYRPPHSPLGALIGPKPFEPGFKSELDLRIANLGEIITALRRQGR